MNQSIRTSLSTFLLPLLLKQRRQTTLSNAKFAAAHDTERGLTLIEGLLSIVIITITIVAITPPIFWATATRVQNQRAEQALNLAQGEIDRVRALVERRENDSVLLEQLPPVAASVSEIQIRENKDPSPRVPAPRSAKASTVISAKVCPNPDDGKPASNINQYIQVDVNSDCEPDFLVQTFRSQGLNARGGAFDPGSSDGLSLSAFVMGVRVYSFVAKEKLDAGNGKVDPAQLRGTTGLGFQQERPLAVLYSTVVRSSDSDNLEVYRRLCEGSSAC